MLNNDGDKEQQTVSNINLTDIFYCQTDDKFMLSGHTESMNKLESNE